MKLTGVLLFLTILTLLIYWQLPRDAGNESKLPTSAAPPIAKMPVPEPPENDLSHTVSESKKQRSTNNRLQSFAQDCSDLADEDNADVHQQLQQVFAAHKHSNKPQQRLAHALFDETISAEAQLNLLSQYQQDFPDNPMVLIELIGLCTNNASEAICGENLIEHAIDVDGDNAALWWQIASYYAAANQHQHTLNALRMATEANRFDSYYDEFIHLFLDNARGTGIGSVGEHLLMAISKSSAKIFSLATLTQFCKNDLHDVKTSHYCLGLGKMAVDMGDTLLFQLVGLEMQKSIYQFDHNDEALAQLEKVQQEMRPSPEYDQATLLLFYDESLLYTWLDNLTQYGESKATQLLKQEVDGLLQDPHYNPCRQ